jgi:mxaL protein
LTSGSPAGVLGARAAAFVGGLRRGRGWMLAAAGVLLIVAAVLPPLPLSRNVVNHLVVFDITQSMYVADQSEGGRAVSRLVFARHALEKALQHLPCGSQVGLGIFASRRTLLLLSPIEVCSNRIELDQAIEQIDARMAWEEASVIVRGVYSATDVAFELPQHPSVVFITDGQESPPMATIPDFDRPLGRVKGALIGVGGDLPLPIPRLDKEGRQVGWWSAGAVVQRPTPAGFARDQEHLSSLHESHLQALAQTAGLGYARLDTEAALENILTDPRLTRKLVVDTDLRWLPAFLAALLLVRYYLRLPARWIAGTEASWRRLRNRVRPRTGA